MKRSAFVTRLAIMSVIIMVALQVAGCSLDRSLLIDSGTYSLVAYPEKKEGSPPSMIVGLQIDRDEGLVDFILRKGDNIIVPYTVREKRVWPTGCPSNLFSFKMEVIDLIPNDQTASILGFDQPILVRNCPDDPYQLVLRADGIIGGSSTACPYPDICIFFSPSETLAGTEHSCQDFALAMDELENEYEELRTWSDQLIEGYGPGIWYFSSSGYPEFYGKVDNPTLENIVAGLNELLFKNGNPTLTVEGNEGRTVRVSLSDDELLSQRMGSTGASGYLQIVTLSLTSLKDIDCVDYKFEPGDHAQPGIYCR
jgi:hypothetical protein